MRLRDLDVLVVANPPPGFGGRYFTFVKLTTDDGIAGWFVRVEEGQVRYEWTTLVICAAVAALLLRWLVRYKKIDALESDDESPASAPRPFEPKVAGQPPVRVS